MEKFDEHRFSTHELVQILRSRRFNGPQPSRKRQPNQRHSEAESTTDDNLSFAKAYTCTALFFYSFRSHGTLSSTRETDGLMLVTSLNRTTPWKQGLPVVGSLGHYFPPHLVVEKRSCFPSTTIPKQLAHIFWTLPLGSTCPRSSLWTASHGHYNAKSHSEKTARKWFR